LAAAAKRGLSVAAAGLLACGGAEPAGEGVVARVDDLILDEGRLAELLVLAQPYALDDSSVEELVRHWIGVTALVRRAAEGDDFTGAEATEASSWLDRREALLRLEREARVGPVEVGSAREAFDQGRLRLIAHVLRRVGPETSPAERDLQRRTAERLLSRLIAGGPWEDAVAESQDPDTRDRSGLLGLFGPGELPGPLERVARRLQPGQVSSVIESEAGFHILYRPAFDDVADLFDRRLRERQLMEASEASDQGVLESRGAVWSPDARRTVARLAADPFASMGSDLAVIRWEGGSLTEGMLARYLAALPTPARKEMIRVANDRVGSFLEEVAVRELRAQDAERDGLRIDDSTEEGLRLRHAEEVGYWLEALDGGPGIGPTQAAVARHMEALVARRIPARSLPVLFEAWLLERVEWSLRRDGMERAVATARRMLEGATSDTVPAGGR
jgi:hypothetical protein